ncbi:MAG: hypothetical protein NTZ49_01345 [Candidatus Parcubacteria bacterium]|nr:hypothetical protein [Candidatus Parcubacteria bacterium]
MLKKIIICLALITLIFSANLALASRFTESLNKTIEDTGYSGERDVNIIAGNIVQGVLGVLGIVFIVLLLYGGTTYMLARGDAKKIEQAKNIIKYAVIGIVIIIVSYSLAYFITTALELAAK